MAKVTVVEDFKGSVLNNLYVLGEALAGHTGCAKEAYKSEKYRLLKLLKTKGVYKLFSQQSKISKLETNPEEVNMILEFIAQMANDATTYPTLNAIEDSELLPKVEIILPSWELPADSALFICQSQFDPHCSVVFAKKGDDWGVGILPPINRKGDRKKAMAVGSNWLASGFKENHLGLIQEHIKSSN